MDIIYTLDNSKGSQTAIIPKSTYKQLETQPCLAEIYAFLHLHNYYKIFKVLIKIPEQYKDCPLGCLDFTEVKRKYKWANHLPLPEMIGKWKPKETTNCVDDDWNTYDVKEDEYYYEINDVTIVKNKKYKREKVETPVEENLNEKVETPIVEEKPRVRRQRPNRHLLLRQETELNAKLEELQTQENALTIQYQEAQSARRVATRELEEAVLAIEEVNKKSLDVKTKQNEVKEEIKKNKIEIAKKNNKNGYVILAHDDYGGKEQVYGYSQRIEEAQTIAKEAVEMGSRRLEKQVAIETDFVVGAKIEALWTKDNKWYGATIWSKNKDKFNVKWNDGTRGQYTWGLELHQIRNITDYNKFNSARIVDLDTQMDIEEYGVDNSNKDIEW